MKIENIPFTVTEWSGVTAVEHRGETGTSLWRVFQSGGLRVRIVDYAAGFRSDHWCARGHVLYVLDGELFVDLKSGSRHRLNAGMSFQAGDDDANPHLAWTRTGARVFIVD